MSAAAEKGGDIGRAQADLSDSESVRDAVSSIGATRAFVNMAFGSNDGMKSTFQALKAGGIKFVVFSSTSGIQNKEEDVPQADFISYIHAQAELNLRAAFGLASYIVIRPGDFTSNSSRWKTMIAAGEVRSIYPAAYWTGFPHRILAP